jgi:uroporphyrinogen III methyltransferase/synthase
VGSATERELENRGIFVDYVPGKYTTADLMTGLIEIIKPGEKVLLARADIADPELYNGLKNKGIDVKDLAVYRTRTVNYDRDRIEKLVNEDRIDLITFTSPSTVNNFVSIVGEANLNRFSGIKVACIGPVTAKAAEKYGFKEIRFPSEYTIDGLVKCIKDWLKYNFR